jgi:hypothetical protein
VEATWTGWWSTRAATTSGTLTRAGAFQITWTRSSLLPRATVRHAIQFGRVRISKGSNPRNFATVQQLEDARAIDELRLLGVEGRPGRCITEGQAQPAAAAMIGQDQGCLMCGKAAFLMQVSNGFVDRSARHYLLLLPPRAPKTTLRASGEEDGNGVLHGTACQSNAQPTSTT